MKAPTWGDWDGFFRGLGCSFWFYCSIWRLIAWVSFLFLISKWAWWAYLQYRATHIDFWTNFRMKTGEKSSILGSKKEVPLAEWKFLVKSRYHPVLAQEFPKAYTGAKVLALCSDWGFEYDSMRVGTGYAAEVFQGCSGALDERTASRISILLWRNPSGTLISVPGVSAPQNTN